MDIRDIQKAWRLMCHADYILYHNVTDMLSFAQQEARQAAEIMKLPVQEEYSREETQKYARLIGEFVYNDEDLLWLLSHGFKIHEEGWPWLIGPSAIVRTSEQAERLSRCGWKVTHRPTPIHPILKDGYA